MIPLQRRRKAGRVSDEAQASRVVISKSITNHSRERVLSPKMTAGRIAQLRELTGQHAWVVTPRQLTAPTEAPAPTPLG